MKEFNYSTRKEVMKRAVKTAPISMALSMALILSSCGGGASLSPVKESEAAAKQKTATGISIGKTELGMPTEPSVEYLRTSMSNSIFLNPPEVDDPAIFVRVRDTSGNNFNMQKDVEERIKQLGYAITKNAKRAVYVVQANVRLAQEVSAFEIAKLDETKYGQDTSKIVESVAKGAAAGAALGIGAGALSDGDFGETAAAGLAGGLVGGLLGGVVASSKDAKRQERIAAKQHTKFYTVLVDIEVRERIQGGELKRQVRAESETDEGISATATEEFVGETVGGVSSRGSSQTTESYTETSEWKSHKARIIGKAKGKLIAFDDVRKDFSDKIAASIAELL